MIPLSILEQAQAIQTESAVSAIVVKRFTATDNGRGATVPSDASFLLYGRLDIDNDGAESDEGSENVSTIRYTAAFDYDAQLRATDELIIEAEIQYDIDGNFVSYSPNTGRVLQIISISDADPQRSEVLVYAIYYDRKTV